AQHAMKLAERARAAGQGKRATQLLTSLAARQPPADVVPRVKEAVAADQAAAATLNAARALVARLQAPALAPSELLPGLQAAAEGLSPTTVGRLAPALALADQPAVKPASLAALVVGGWCAGTELATQEPTDAARFWKMRETARRMLAATTPAAYEQRLNELLVLEPTGDLMARLVEHLPAPPTNAKPDAVHTVVVDDPESPAVGVKLHVYLPPDYDPYRAYPTVVTLAGLLQPPLEQCEWWRADAAAWGFIVVAPEWRADVGRGYEFSDDEHARILAAVAAARKRFAVDADRVFLHGHDIGGVAAWDVGMAHPDEWAGLAPFTASPLFYCARYWPNLGLLPVYAVEGAANGANPPTTAAQFTRYFNENLPALYVEYPGRGRELFSDELPSLFDWMNRQRRPAAPAAFQAVSARLGDRRFYWCEIASFLPNATVPPSLYNRGKVKPAKIEASADDGNKIQVTTAGVDDLRLLIPLGLVHRDDPRLTVTVQRKMIHRGPLPDDYDLMFREMRRTGDRRRLIVAELRARP
ncbi:MAG: hypothetical protein ACRDD1_07685, partial [Planctomycetia bacterium]